MSLFDSSLKLLLKAENTSLDDSGNGNDALLTGVVYDEIIKAHGIASFKLDGLNDFLRVLHHASLNFGTGDFTIGCKLYPKTSTALMRFLEKGAGGTTPLFRVEMNANNTITFITYDGVSAVVQRTSALTVPDLGFLTLLCERESDGVSIYIDNVNDGKTLGSAVDINNTSDVYIGKTNSGTPWWADMNLDEISFWARKLTAAEKTEYKTYGVIIPNLNAIEAETGRGSRRGIGRGL